MSANEIWFLVLVLFANTVQTISGFAGAMITVPIGMHLIGLDPTRTITNIIGLLPSLFILIKGIKRVAWKEGLKITLIMLAGMLSTKYIKTAFDSKYFSILYGCLIIGVALFNLFSKKEVRLSKAGEIIILIAAGVIHGFFTSGGSLVVIYCMNKFKDSEVFRATLSSAWMPLGTVLYFMHLSDGLLTPQTYTLSLISLPVVFLSIFIGGKIYKHTDQKTFYKITNILLLGCGALMFVN